MRHTSFKCYRHPKINIHLWNMNVIFYGMRTILIMLWFSDRSFAYTETTTAEPVHVEANPPQPQSRTAPGRLEAHEGDSEDEHQNLRKVRKKLFTCFKTYISLLLCWHKVHICYFLLNNNSTHSYSIRSRCRSWKEAKTYIKHEIWIEQNRTCNFLLHKDPECNKK